MESFVIEQRACRGHRVKNWNRSRIVQQTEGNNEIYAEKRKKERNGREKKEKEKRNERRGALRGGGGGQSIPLTRTRKK